MNNPKLRFKGYIEEWEQRKFGDLADYKKGPFGSAITKDMFVAKSDEAIKVYEQQNAINKDWSLERYFLPKEYAYSKLKSFEVHGGDIIVSCAGTIGEIYEIPENADSGVINQALMRVRVNDAVVDKKMFITVFSNMIDAFTRTHSNGSAIKNIPPFADLKPMEVLLPMMEEQKKISGYFATLGRLITLHQRKCEQAKKLKKYMLQKMFPKNGESVPEIRFSGFTDAWEQRKFGDVNDLITGYPFESEKFVEDGIKLVRGMNVKRGYLDFSNEICMRWISSEGLENYLLEDGDILIQMDGALIGKSYARINENQLPALLVQRVTRARTKKEVASPEFMYQTIQRDFLDYILRNKTETAVPHLSLNDIRDFKIMVPKLEEQKKIGEYFSSLDTIIILHQRKCEKLQNMKKYMLQNMFV